MTLEELVMQYEAALGDGGAPMDAGCSGARVEQVLASCRERFNKPYCLVADWQWWDLKLPAESIAALAEERFLPAILYAENVVYDEQQRFPVGGFVRSTVLVALHDNCIFETRNTLYILQGPGKRKSVDPKTALSIF